jgi:hypothetical protein
MKSGQILRFEAPRLLVLANVLFWVVFGAFFAIKSYPYKPHAPGFEGGAPDIIYFGRAFSYLENEQLRPLMRVTRLVQLPSFYAARPFFWYFNKHDIFVDHLYGGISVGGYHLLIVCVISILQWFLLGILIDYIRRRIRNKTKHASGKSHACDAPASP